MDAVSLPAPNGLALAVPAGTLPGEAARCSPNIREFDFDGLVDEVAFQIFCDPGGSAGIFISSDLPPGSD
jgi:hypothetical protein